eukprot:symbB.v1.2.003663.t2/scaffold175.1/size369221/19
MELVEDYSRGSRSAKIFCVKDVAGCRCWDACLYLSRNDWDVEAALQSFYSTKVATQEAVKPAAWSSGGAKPLGVWLKRKEVDCPICVEKYAPGNKTIMTKCCFQVLCGKCYSRLTDSTGRFSCPFCRGADGLERDDIEEIDPPRLSRYRRMVEALTPPVDMQRLHRCHNGLKQLAPTCLLCVAVVVCNICAASNQSFSSEETQLPFYDSFLGSMASLAFASPWEMVQGLQRPPVNSKGATQASCRLSTVAQVSLLTLPPLLVRQRLVKAVAPRARCRFTEIPRPKDLKMGDESGGWPQLVARVVGYSFIPTMSRRNSGVQLTGHFIGQSHSLARQVGSLQGKTCRESLRHILTSHYVANVMAIVVLIDTVCTCSAIDARADGGRDPSFVVLFISDACLALYTLELLLLLSVTGSQILRDWMMLMDALIVACGWAEIILLQVIPQDILGFRIKVLRVLRLVRIFRPIRLLKRIRGLRELYKLASMMATCFRTLLWCFLLCFVVMTGWAMLMVEIVYPAVQDMHENHGFFTDCEQCQRAMSSVMDANLLLFKTVIAGDSWGEIAVPVIQEHPWTSVIFVGSMLTLVFGVVNLIVAVVVDTFADSRQNDVQNLAEELEDEIEHDRTALAKLFKRIDKDGSGQLTLEELIQGARHDRAFQSRLRVMDIDENLDKHLEDI